MCTSKNEKIAVKSTLLLWPCILESGHHTLTSNGLKGVWVVTQKKLGFMDVNGG